MVEVDRSLTRAPSLIRYVHRLFWEAMHLALPVCPLLLTIARFAGVAVLAVKRGKGGAACPNRMTQIAAAEPRISPHRVPGQQKPVSPTSPIFAKF